MQTCLHRLEEHLLRGAVDCAAMLGVSYSNYAAMKAGSRRIPAYVEYHVEALIALPVETVHTLARKRIKKR